jgi:hypothetical protein
MTQDGIVLENSATTDKASFNTAEKAVEDLAKGAEQVSKAVDKDAKSFDKLNKGLDKLKRQKTMQQMAKDAAALALKTKDVDKGLEMLIADMKTLGDVTESEIQQSVKAFDKLIDKQKEAGQQAIALAEKQKKSALELRDIRAKASEEQFDVVSREVGSLGDVESGVRTIGGGLEAAGFGEVGAGIGVLAEVPAVAEALPRLAESAKAAPAALKAAGTSLLSMGPAGAAAAAAVAVAAVAFHFASKAIQKDAEEAKRVGNALIEVNALVIQGDREALQARADTAQQSIDIAKTNQLELEALAKEADRGIQVSDFLDPFVTTAEDELKNLAKEQEEIAKQEQAVLDRLREEGIEPLAEATDDVTDSLDDTAQSLIDKAMKEAEATQAQEEYTEAIDEAAEAAREAAEKIDAARAKYATALKDIGRTELRALEDINRKASQASVKARNKLTDDLTKLDEKTADARLKTTSKAATAEIKAREKLDASLAKIAEKGDKAALSAAENRDFLAFAKAKESATEEAKAAIDNADAAKKERQQALQETLTESANAQIEQRKQLLENFAKARDDRRTALTQQLDDARRAASRRRDDARIALNRELEQAQAGARAKLSIESNYLKASVSQVQSALGAIRGGGAGSPVNNVTSNIRNVSATVNQRFSGRQNPSAIAQNVLAAIRGLG